MTHVYDISLCMCMCMCAEKKEEKADGYVGGRVILAEEGKIKESSQELGAWYCHMVDFQSF